MTLMAGVYQWCPHGCLPKTGRFEVTGDDSIHAQVPRHGHLKVPFVVEAGCLLKWEFATRDYDVSFGLLYENDDGKQVLVCLSDSVSNYKLVSRITAS